MLEEPALLTVKRNFARPSQAELEAVATACTGWLVDAQDGRASLGPRIKPVLTGPDGLTRFSGTAVTCWCGPNDNLAIFGALAVARPGDVVIAATDGFSGSGVCGDLLAGMLRNKGVVALVTDGHVRDLAGLREAGLPVFAAGINPDSCVRSGPGTVGLPVVIGGRQISSGDLVLGDEDGVATIPLESAKAILARLEQVKAAEAKMLAAVKGGLQLPDWLQEMMASSQVRSAG